MTHLGIVALENLKLGFPVFPVEPGGKKPIVKWQPYQRTLPHEQQIQGWWIQWPDANIGMATGQLSRLVVVDCDSEEAIERFVQCHPTAASTRRSRTGRGEHFYFQFEPGIRNLTGLSGEGIDIRGEGGYVILPPSLHASGQTYEWINDFDPLPLPDAFKAILNRANRKHRFPLLAVNDESEISAGFRNTTLTSFAGTMRNRGMCREAIEVALLVENERHCNPPLAEPEVKGIAESVARYTPNLTSDPIQSSSEVKFTREVNLGDLQAAAIEGGGPTLEFLPILGQEKFIVRGWSHIISAYPKTGKTELLVRAMAEWPAETILYITEEPQAVWQARLRELPTGYNHVNLFFGLGLREIELKNRIMSGNETVVILDTLRTLLGLQDEKDNSHVARMLVPYISESRKKGHTLLAIHHERKGGGEHGEGIAGGGVFLGVFDRAIELKRSAKNPNQRVLHGYGRVVERQEIVFELGADKQISSLGSPQEVRLQKVKARLWEVLDDEWKKTAELTGAIGAPTPSIDQATKALEELATEAKAERDPPITAGKRQGVTYKWRKSSATTSDSSALETEEMLDT